MKKKRLFIILPVCVVLVAIIMFAIFIIKSNRNPVIYGEFPLNKKDEQFLFGTWKVDKLLGFTYIREDDKTEYPTGQKIIGDEIIITKDKLSTMGLINYERYQKKEDNPEYFFYAIYNDPYFFLTSNRIDIDEGVQEWGIKSSDRIRILFNPGTFCFTFIVVNDEKLIFLMESSFFELVKERDF
ncbi:MAG: hypothetical protein FWC60_05880 [Firmicutes bacterium]|nr:hypothetical protein [Bacillota bacterium]